MALKKEQLVDIIDNTDNDLIKNLAKQKVAEEFQGDEVAQKNDSIISIIVSTKSRC